MTFEGLGHEPAQTRERVDAQERLDFRRLYLTEDQAEYVDAPLYVADKIETLLDSQKNIVAGDDIEQLLLESHQVAGANCHKTALFLTGENTAEQLWAPDNDNPQTAGHEYVERHSKLFPDSDALSRGLTKQTFPYRISFFKRKKNGFFADHSITLIGISNKGTLIGFEKMGPYADTPFKYINAMKSITAYLSNSYIAGLQND